MSPVNRPSGNPTGVRFSSQLTEVTEKLHASADVLQRTVVVAPVSGTVVDLTFKTAGMPVEVLIVTERRTMFDYISKPFRDAFWRSFRES